MTQLQMFGLNLWFLIELLVCGFFALVLLIASWTGIKIWLFQRGQSRAERENRRRKFDSGGRPIAPSAPGVCHQCGAAFREVHHLPSGERLCPTCYQRRAGGL